MLAIIIYQRDRAVRDANGIRRKLHAQGAIRVNHDTGFEQCPRLLIQHNLKGSKLRTLTILRIMTNVAL